MSDKTQTTIYLPREVRERIESLAFFGQRSMSGQIVYMLQRSLVFFEQETGSKYRENPIGETDETMDG